MLDKLHHSNLAKIVNSLIVAHSHPEIVAPYVGSALFDLTYLLEQVNTFGILHKCHSVNSSRNQDKGCLFKCRISFLNFLFGQHFKLSTNLFRLPFT